MTDKKIVPAKKTISLGLSDYKELVASNYSLIDKSLLIKDFWDMGNQSALVVRPRRFGKTLNLSMLYHFFDITQQKENRTLFLDKAIASATLADGSPAMDLQGQYPCIFLTLKDMTNPDYDTFLKNLASNVSELYRQHDYLLKSSQLTKGNLQIFQRLINGEGNLIDLKKSLRFLSDCLHQHWDEKVIILLDEYDNPVHAAYVCKTPYHQELLLLFKDFIGGAFKDNPYLKKGLITGIMRISMMNLFSGTNNIPVYTMLSPDYGQYFGFSEPEVAQVFELAHLDYPAEDIEAYYNGYRSDEHVLFNPWSILHCAQSHGVLSHYWTSSGQHDLLRRALGSLMDKSVADDFLTLLNDGVVRTKIEEQQIFQQMGTEISYLWSMMFYAGYLKVTGKHPNEQGFFDYDLAIPNKEVKMIFEDIARDWLREPTGNLSNRLLHNLQQKEIAHLVEEIQRYINSAGSYYQFQSSTKEAVYHLFLVGLMYSLDEHYKIRSELEAGDGRSDLILIPRKPGGVGLVIELKTINLDDETDQEILSSDADRATKAQKRERLLELAADKALAQINAKDYADYLKEEGCSSGYHIGLAFYMKKVCAASRVVKYN